MAITMCGPKCTTEIKNSGRPCGDRQVSYEGAVLNLRERNGYNDSDFFATVWDAAEGRVREIMYGTTAGWSYHNHAKVDATPEVEATARATYAEYLTGVFTRAREHDATKPAKGAVVRSTTTRGKNKGVVGEITWEGEDKYRTAYGDRYSRVVPMRYGIRVEGEDKLHYLPDYSVEVVTPAPGPTDEEIAERAEKAAATSNWQSLMALPAAAFGLVGS